MALGHEHDTGFDREMFAAQLSRITRINPATADQYGVGVEAFQGVQERTMSWAVRLRDEQPPDRRLDQPRRAPPHRQHGTDDSTDRARRPTSPDRGHSL
jgi:hypothetical protein